MNSKQKIYRDDIKKIENSFWSFLIKKWRLTLVIIFSIIIGGIISINSMVLESDPEVEIPIGIVNTSFFGASPSDVEKLVTDKLESKIQNLDNIKKINSISQENISSITVEFEADADINDSIRELRDSVNEAKSELPEDASDPSVMQIRTNDMPIVTFSLMGDLNLKEFKQISDDLKMKLEAVNGVSKVSISGIEDEEIQILIDKNKLESRKISISEVVQSIELNHIDMPIGNIISNGFYYQSSIKAQFQNENELLNIPIANRNNQNIFLKDIAEIRKVFANKSSITNIYQKSTGKETSAITFQVYKKTGASIIDIIDKSKKVIDNYKDKNLNQNIDILVTGDNSVIIREDLSTLSKNGIQAIIIIFILLLLALGFKEAILAASSIPLIFFITFIVLFLLGESVNFLVLFSLILSVGLIVDTSIIMMEGVHDNINHKKMDSRDASLLSISTYKNPLISSTLTTISAFVPMALMSGMIGQYMSHIPKTVSITLFASLFVAILILPSIAVKIFKKSKVKTKKKKTYLSILIDPFKKFYYKKLKSILKSKFKRRLILFIMFILVSAAISTPILGILKIEMWPKFNGDYFTVSVEGPIGSQLEDTRKITKQLEEKIKKLPEIKNFVTIVGGSALAITSDAPMSGGLGGSTSANKASITVNLIAKKFRKYKAFDISDMLRNNISDITNSKITIQDLQTGPPSGADIEVRILGDNLAEMETFSNKVKKIISGFDGLRDVESDMKHGTGEFHFKLDRDKLKFYGISASQLAMELRSVVYGNNDIKIIKNGDETPIVVRIDFRDEDCKNDIKNIIISKRDKVSICNLNPKSIDDLLTLLIMTPKGQVRLSELVDVKLSANVNSIKHYDGDKVINIKAFTKKGYTTQVIQNKVSKKLKNIEVPKNIEIQYGGEFEDMQDSFNSLFYAMYIGLVLIILILILQFNSFKQPLIIVTTLPLALIGVFFGLILIGRSLSFPGFIGIVALSGIVVNDAIVLIDQINNNIRLGLEKIEAIAQAGRDRIQAIFLTTITTASGVLPLIWASTFWIDLALSIFFGIIFATILTLIVIPILYNAFEGKSEIDIVKRGE